VRLEATDTRGRTTAGRSGTAGGRSRGATPGKKGLTNQRVGSSVETIGSDHWGRLVRADFGRLLRHNHSRISGPGWRLAARARCSRRIALAAVVLLVSGGGQLDTALAAPRAAPDPHPAAKGSTGTPAPDPYATTISPPAQPPAAVTPVRAPEPRLDTTTTPSTGAERTVPRATGTREKADGATKPATRSTKPTPVTVKRAVPTPPIAAAADGGRLLVGGLALAALALASGSLLLFTTRAGGLEPRS
jgi:hypothetical protein